LIIVGVIENVLLKWWKQAQDKCDAGIHGQSVVGVLGRADHRERERKLDRGVLKDLSSLPKGLDAAAKRKLWEVIRAARDTGMTIVMTSHR
jgi:transposase-like protein